jgi:hypothetical protein
MGSLVRLTTSVRCTPIPEPVPSGEALRTLVGTVTLAELSLQACVVPPDHHAFTQLDSLKWVTFVECRTPDGTPITTMDIPGVQTQVD